MIIKKIPNIYYLYLFICILPANIDHIYGIDFLDVGDRLEYFKLLKDPIFFNRLNFGSFFNFEYTFSFLLQFFKTINIFDKYFPLRAIIFLTSFLFLDGFRRRTKNNFLPIILFFTPNIIDLFIIKFRHGLALSLFNYISIIKKDLKNILYLIPCSSTTVF